MLAHRWTSIQSILDQIIVFVGINIYETLKVRNENLAVGHELVLFRSKKSGLQFGTMTNRATRSWGFINVVHFVCMFTTINITT